MKLAHAKNKKRSEIREHCLPLLSILHILSEIQAE